MEYEEVIDILKSMSNSKNVEGMQRFGKNRNKTKSTLMMML